MALIVEDGTIVTDAESYITVDDADAYHTARGNAAWTGADAAKEALLRKATDYMGQVYGLRWKGDRVSASQVLDWPRDGVEAFGFDVDSDAVPDAVVQACAELALRALRGALTPDVTRRTVREKVGPIEVEYDRNAPALPDYQAVDNLLAPYLVNAGSGAFRTVVRT